MLKSYFNIAWRNLVKYRLYSLINIFGLATGIVTSSIIMLFVFDEFNYDTWHENSDRIYRIAHERITSGMVENQATTPIYLGSVVKERIPAIKDVVRFLRDNSSVVKIEDQLFNETQFAFADPSAFNVFNLRLIKGDRETVLSNPDEVVINQSVAKKYFGSEEPIGKLITYRNWGQEFTHVISGVMEDIPHNSHFQFEILAPFESPTNLWNNMHQTDWFMSGVTYTYVELNEGISPETVVEQLQNLVKSEMPESLKAGTTFYLQPFNDIYLSSHLANELESNGNHLYLFVFTTISILVLIIACINFMNLATARSFTRAREVGVRKVFGAQKKMLIQQFLSEAVLISIIALLLSMILIQLALPLFNQLADKNLVINYITDWPFVVALLTISILTALLSGVYPAFYLSSFRPAQVLKTNSTLMANRKGWFRQGLVIFQFSVSILLLVAILTITNQIRFMQNKELGFDKEYISFISGFDFQKYSALKTAVSGINGVVKVGGGFSVPGSINATPFNNLYRLEGMAPDERIQAPFSAIDYSFLDVMDIKVIEGRGFSQDFPNDRTESLIINNKMAKASGWNNPIGKEIEIYNMVGQSSGKRKVIGVVEDFHFESLHQEIKPLVYGFNQGFGGVVVIKFAGSDVVESIKQVKNVMAEYNGNGPAQLYFLDQDMELLYQKESRLRELISVFGILAILISSLGLFGLASFTGEQKRKEIGIRKVLGASVTRLAFLFTTDITRLILISAVIASPITYYLLDGWLNNFAYRTDITVSSFLIAGLLSILIAWVTIGYHSIKSAMVNPVQALRDD